MILKCKLLQESYNFSLKRGKFKILKKKTPGGCHGNIKLDGYELATPNCSQIHFRKIHEVW